MKKLLVLPMLCGVLGLAACSSSENTVDIFGQKCEKIATGEQGDFIAKCPVAPELDSIRAADKNSQFLSAVVNFEEVAADAEHIYVNVIPAGTIGNVPVNCYRVLGTEPVVDTTVMYATEICIQ